MTRIIIGNLFSFISCIFLLKSIKSKEKINMLKYQVLDCFFYITADIFFKAYSALFTQIISLIRNILGMKNKLNYIMIFILSMLMVIVGIIVNTNGLIGFIPIIASVLYTILLNHQNIKVLKLSLFLNMLLWVIFDILILDIVSFIVDLIVCIFSLIHFIKLCKEKA